MSGRQSAQGTQRASSHDGHPNTMMMVQPPNNNQMPIQNQFPYPMQIPQGQLIINQGSPMVVHSGHPSEYTPVQNWDKPSPMMSAEHYNNYPQHRPQHVQSQPYPQQQFMNEQEYLQYMNHMQRQNQVQPQRPIVVGSQPVYYQHPQMQPPGYPQPSQYYYQEGYEGEQDPQVVWEKKFMIVYERFEWEYQKLEAIRSQYFELCEQLKTVDSQEDWNELKQHHEELMDKFNEMQEELAAIINQNNQLAADQNLEFEEVWEQRYHELLANFKSLQQEMAEVQQGHSHKASYDQRREQELVEQYHQLQQEYGNVMNELKLYKERDPSSSQVNQYRQKLEYALEEGQKYKSILDKLHQQNEEMQGIINNLEEQNNALKRQLNSRSKVNIQQYEHLLEVTEQKEDELSEARVQREMAFRENKKLREELEIKQEEVQRLRGAPRNRNQAIGVNQEYTKIIQIKTDEIAQYRSMLKSAEEDFKISILDKENTLTHHYEEKINALNKEIRRLEAKFVESQDTKPMVNAKIQSYEKKITYFEQETANLNQTITRKNQQLTELRALSYEIDKAKNIQISHQSLEKERDQLKEDIKKKNKQIQTLKNNIYQLETKLRNFSNKKPDFSAKFLNEEIEQLKQMLTKKEFELSKGRQTLQSKENHISQAQAETQKFRSKLSALEKSFESERENYKTQIEKLEVRNKEYEKRVRNLEFEYGDTMKNNLQNEINSLRGQNQSKQESVNRLEAEQLDLKSRVANLERQKKDADSDVRQLRVKLDEYERWKVDYVRQMEQTQTDLTNREKEIKEMQLSEISVRGQFGSLQGQVGDHESTLKAKNSIIRELEEENQKLSRQLDGLSRDYDELRKQYRNLSEESKAEIFRLNDQLRQGGGGSSLYLSKSKSRIDVDSNNYARVINALKEENERLKMELARLFQVDYQKSVVSPRAGEGLDYIQKRLNEFKSRLEGIIHVQEVQRTADSPIRQSPVRSARSTRGEEEDADFKGDFQNLKNKLVHLQQYCASLQIKLGGSQVIEPDPKHSQVFLDQERQFSEQVNFYKSKAEDFESRVDHLLQVNSQLKMRVQSLLNDKNEFSSVNYYKEQCMLSDKNIELLTQKTRKLTDENRSLRQAAFEAHSKALFQKDRKIDQLSDRIQQLTRKIRQVELEKTSLNNEKTNISHQMRQQQTEFSMTRRTLEEKINQYESHTTNLMDKCSAYELQIKELNLKYKRDDYRSNLSRQLSDADDKYYGSRYEISSPTKSRKKDGLLRDFEYVL